MAAVKMAHLGPAASFSQEAMERFGVLHNLDLEGVMKTPFDAVFAEIVGVTGIGIIPIENSRGGLVYPNLDFILGHDIAIIGEYYLPVRQFLLGYGEASDIDGKTVHSHPQGVDQCAKFIQTHNLVIGPMMASTSGGGRVC